MPRDASLSMSDFPLGAALSSVPGAASKRSVSRNSRGFSAEANLHLLSFCCPRGWRVSVCDDLLLNPSVVYLRELQLISRRAYNWISS